LAVRAVHMSAIRIVLLLRRRQCARRGPENESDSDCDLDKHGQPPVLSFAFHLKNGLASAASSAVANRIACLRHTPATAQSLIPGFVEVKNQHAKTQFAARRESRIKCA